MGGGGGAGFSPVGGSPFGPGGPGGPGVAPPGGPASHPSPFGMPFGPAGGGGGGGPGGGGPGGGGGVPGGDPFASGRWSHSLDPTRRRQAPEIYWRMRAAAQSARDWLTSYYRGSRAGQEWVDLWGAAEALDLTLNEAHLLGGYPGVCHRLSTDDRVEGWCCRISAQVTFLRTGERQMLDALQSAKPPGASDLAPDWAVSGARDLSCSLYLQAGRVRGIGLPGAQGQNDGAEDDQSGRRRVRRRPRGGNGGQASSAASSQSSSKAPPPAKA